MITRKIVWTLTLNNFFVICVSTIFFHIPDISNERQQKISRSPLNWNVDEHSAIISQYDDDNN